MTEMRVRTSVPIAETLPVKTERWELDSVSDPPVETYTLIRDLSSVESHHQDERFEDRVTPRWHDLKNSGGIANNPMKQTVTIRKDKFTSLYIYDSMNVKVNSDPAEWKLISALTAGNQSSLALCEAKGGYLESPAIDSEDLIDRAVTKAQANVSLNEAYALVMLGESRKTVLSMISITKRLIKILRSIKRLDSEYLLKSAKKYEARQLLKQLSGKELADRYMELRYALRPLMYDIAGTAAALTYDADKQKARNTFRGNEYKVKRVEQTDTYSNGNWPGPDIGSSNNWSRDWTARRRTKHSVDVRAGVLTELEATNSLPVWGLMEPIESAWELIPFSFIVDWFINLGDKICAWTPDFGLKHLASWSMVTDTVVKEFQIMGSSATLPTGNSDYAPLEHVNLFGKEGYCSETIITRTRTPNPGFSVIPSINLNLDMLKLVDLLIIAKSFLGK